MFRSIIVSHSLITITRWLWLVYNSDWICCIIFHGSVCLFFTLLTVNASSILKVCFVNNSLALENPSCLMVIGHKNTSKLSSPHVSPRSLTFCLAGMSSLSCQLSRPSFSFPFFPNSSLIYSSSELLQPQPLVQLNSLL